MGGGSGDGMDAEGGISSVQGGGGARDALSSPAQYVLTHPRVHTPLAPAQDVLTSLIHNGYSSERMAHFLRVIGSALDGYVKARTLPPPLIPPPLHPSLTPSPPTTY